MAGTITHKPPFDPPQNFKKARLWSQTPVINGRSDGQPRHWPGTPTYRPSADEFYLCILGQKWAQHNGTAQQGVQYYLDKLPDGYAMFEMNQPNGTQVYRRLFGHPSGRFYDSALRFESHFIWLMSGMNGDCSCILCAKSTGKPVIPRPRIAHEVTYRPTAGGSEQPRVPREVVNLFSAGLQPRLRDVPDGEDGHESSRTSSTGRGIAANRAQRQIRQLNASAAVDEEGQEDVYKDCVKRLESARGGKRGVEIDIQEEGSIDWKADRHLLAPHFTRIEQQHCFIPRIGELVLWCPEFLDQHHLMQDPKSSEYKFYSFEQKCFHGFPAWRGGIVAGVPSATVKNGPIDFPDILDTPVKKTAFNTAGFRIETMPDPNDDVDKSLSKQYRYVPLRNIRPLNHWQMLLQGIARDKLHSSIEHALTCMTSISLLEKWRFNGDWPNARIFCRGLYLGAELITVGDAVRLLPSEFSEDLRPEVVVVESIRYNLLDMQPEHTKADQPGLCNTSYIALVGTAYTTDLEKLRTFRFRNSGDLDTPTPMSSSRLKNLFRAVGTDEYGPWYMWHTEFQKYEVSHEQVLGRLYEADAVRLWTSQRSNPATSANIVKGKLKPSLGFDAAGVMAARRYASATDARLPEPDSKDTLNWFFADTRVEALAVATINGLDVGKYHDVRTPTTLKYWRTQVRIADGQPLPTEIASEYITDLTQIQLYTGSRRGRKAGTRVVDGKVVFPGKASRKHSNLDGYIRTEGIDTEEDDIKHKPSSQMAGAAFATDYDSSEGYDSGEDDEDEDEDGGNKDEEETDEDTVEVPLTSSRLPQRQHQPNHGAKSKPMPGLSKTAIMSSVEIPADAAFADDDSDAEKWWDDPLPPARGGTEESEGGDYKE